MKLTNPSDVYKGDNAGPNAEIVDQLLHAAPTATKRSRSARSKISSLEYKVVKDKTKGKEAPTTTKPVIRKDPQQQQAEQQQQQQNQQYFRRGLTTRARGSSGPPPRRYELKDLEGMTEEQLLQALYEDPELAAAATKAAEESKHKRKKEKRSSSPPTGAPTGAKKSRESSRFYRGADGIAADSAEYPDHLKEMMDQGVPVVQWVVLLLLVVIGLWSLRKTLKGPDKASPSKSTERGATKAKGKKSKKGKPQKVEIPDTLVESLLDDKPEEIPASTRSIPARKASNAAKKQAPKKKKKVKQQANGVANNKKEEKPKQQSSSEGGEPDKATTRATTNIPIHRTEPEDDGDWLPVTKSQKAASTEPKQSKPKAASSQRSANGSSAGKPNNGAKKASLPVDDSPEDPTESSMPELTDEVPFPVEAAESAAPAAAMEVPPTTNGSEANSAPDTVKSSKKKKKKKKVELAKVEPVAPVTPSTDADAALAMKLQKEEETLLKKSTAKKAAAEDDVWEQVTNKKKKGKNVATA